MRRRVAWAVGLALTIPLLAAGILGPAEAEEAGDSAATVEEVCLDCGPACDEECGDLAAPEDEGTSDTIDVVDVVDGDGSSVGLPEATEPEQEAELPDVSEDAKADRVGEPADPSGDEPLPPAGLLGDTTTSKALLKQARAGSSVAVAETGETYDTLAEAIAGAEAAGKSVYTLKIVDNVIETEDVIITSNVTIVGAEGAHTITFSSPPYTSPLFAVRNGGSLTLGDGTNADPLTILHNVSVTDGSALVRDGITLSGGGYSLDLNGANATGKITGGRLLGGWGAISVEGGARLSEISGGYFTGVREALFTYGAGTEVGEISGGSFYQTDPDIALHGQTLFVDGNSVIRKISGGYFEATKNSALGMTRGGWIDVISGGDFVAKRVGVFNSDPDKDTRNAAAWVEGENTTTGIGTISGGHFRGAYFGLLLIQRNAPVRLNSITGGLFEGSVGLQNDRGASIGEITGGKIQGTAQGMLNVSPIDKIGGTVEIIGGSQSGISNYPTGVIGEISGGQITSTSSSGISNQGTIDLISGGTIIGFMSAISCSAMSSSYPAVIDTITNGVFWGKMFSAIELVRPLKLEPGLEAVKGFGRYWGANGKIFNDENLVNYPVNPRMGPYRMSSATEPVSGISGTQFKYLMYDIPANYHNVIVKDSYADVTGAGGYFSDETVTIDAGDRDGYTFAGWTTNDGVTFDDATSATTTFTMPNKNVTVTANWDIIRTPATVTVIDSYADITGAGVYDEDATVTINAGTRDGYTFAGWITEDDVEFVDASSATTTFSMPAQDVTVTATWTPIPPSYAVTVINSHADVTGAGTYQEGSTVTIDAGTLSGNVFTGWTSEDGVVLVDATSATTTFLMPARDVTVTATWEAIVPSYAVTVVNSYADVTGAGRYQEGSTVTINAGSRSDFTFAGWTTSDGVVFSDAAAAMTTFSMPAQDVTVTATWAAVEPTYTVTVVNSFADVTGAGSYVSGVAVTIHAGSRSGYTFAGWTTSDGVVFAGASSPTTSFTMPAKNVTVTATWIALPLDPISGTSTPKPTVPGTKTPGPTKPGTKAPSPRPTSGLASTGSERGPMLLTASMLLTIAGVLCLSSWRRRKHTEATHTEI
ncbi:MAG: InlB B-repeat-containing protein [Micrococcales bacterium]|nr:InlB B-repeat-containing protein [Micrococcales bacterium]